MSTIAASMRSRTPAGNAAPSSSGGIQMAMASRRPIPSAKRHNASGWAKWSPSKALAVFILPRMQPIRRRSSGFASANAVSRNPLP